MENRQTTWKKTDLIFVLVCSVFLYTHLFVFPATPIFYEEDHLMFLTDAWRMYLGEALYRDFFQLTFPGTQVLYLGLLTLFGTSFWIVSAVIFLQGISQVLIWLAIARRMFGRSWHAYLPVSIFLFFGFRWFGLDGSHRMLSPVFIGLAILCLLKFDGYRRIILAGACCAISTFFTQQRGFIVIAAIGVFLIIESFRDRSGWKRLLTDEAALVCSFLIATTLLVSPFLVSAGVGTFLDDTILYLRHYVQGSVSNSYGAFLTPLRSVLSQGILIASVTLVYYALIPLVYLVAFYYLLRRKYSSAALLVALVGFFLAFGTVAPVPGRMFQIAMPAVTIFTWLIFQIKTAGTMVKYAVCSLAFFGLALGIRTQLQTEMRYLDSPTGTVVFLSEVVVERYRWLLDNTRKGEYLFEAYEPAVNFPLQLRNPTPVTLVWDNAFTPEWHVQAVLDGLRTNKPRFILWDGKWNKEASERAPDDKLAPLYDYLRENYAIEKNFTPYSNREMQVWRRK